MKLINTFNSLITEYYNSEELHDREYMVRRLNMRDQKGFFMAPKGVREYIQKLPYIDCYDSEGNKKICTKIPEFIHIYLINRH